MIGGKIGVVSHLVIEGNVENGFSVIASNDTIHIGYYVLDSNLEAGNIFVQAENGKTIRGTIKAKTKVALRLVGNVFEKETYINVEGFNRHEIKRQLDNLLVSYKHLLTEIEESEEKLQAYEKAYPSTFLEIKRMQKKIEQITTGTFYAQDNEMKRD